VFVKFVKSKVTFCVTENWPKWVPRPVAVVTIVVPVTASEPWNVPLSGTNCCAAAGTTSAAAKIIADIGR